MSQIKVDKVLRLVRDEAAEVAADDAVPCCAFLAVELLWKDISGKERKGLFVFGGRVVEGMGMG